MFLLTASRPRGDTNWTPKKDGEIRRPFWTYGRVESLDGSHIGTSGGTVSTVAIGACGPSGSSGHI